MCPLCYEILVICAELGKSAPLIKVDSVNINDPFPSAKPVVGQSVYGIQLLCCSATVELEGTPNPSSQVKIDQINARSTRMLCFCYWRVAS